VSLRDEKFPAWSPGCCPLSNRSPRVTYCQRHSAATERENRNHNVKANSHHIVERGRSASHARDPIRPAARLHRSVHHDHLHSPDQCHYPPGFRAARLPVCRLPALRMGRGPNKSPVQPGSLPERLGGVSTRLHNVPCARARQHLLDFHHSILLLEVKPPCLGFLPCPFGNPFYHLLPSPG
jgi:hypothetical protein